MSDTTGLCEKCGATPDQPHTWSEGTCVLPHRYTKPNHPPAASIGHCCRWCIDRHRDWLTEVVELYATLDQVVEQGSVVEEGTGEYQKPRKRPASPALMRLDAWSMLCDRDRLFRTGDSADLPDVPAVLACHAGQLWDDLGYGDAPDTVTGAAAVLRARADDVARSPWVDEYDADLRWLRTALRRAHGLSNPKPLGSCLTVDCEGRVWRDEEGGQPSCDRCKRRYGTHDIVRLHAQERSVSA